jgi:truncated hemoglobin YjbI
VIRTTLLASFGALALLITACGGNDSDDTAGSTGGSTANPTADPTADVSSTTAADTTANTTGDVPTTSGTTGAAVCVTDVCMTYGAAVPAVASKIVDDAAADPLFMADFAPLVAEGPAAVQAFKDSLANFISDAYGCTANAYTGPTMEAAHAGMGITQSEYDAFIGLIVNVLVGAGVPDDDINLCFAPPLVDPAFVATIVGQ